MEAWPSWRALGQVRQRSLSLAAAGQDPTLAAEYTSRGNLVAVVTNGTAVLGLGNIGPLASKPVMEGKGCLFKKFAGIDVFDIELAERDPDKLVDIIAATTPVETIQLHITARTNSVSIPPAPCAA